MNKIESQNKNFSLEKTSLKYKISIGEYLDYFD